MHSVLTIGNSPEDQAILEAEFDRNPRPDKAARRSLVQRVALGEKEVQVRTVLIHLVPADNPVPDLVPEP